MVKFNRSEMAMFNKNIFAGCNLKSLFFRMMITMAPFPRVPKTTSKKIPTILRAMSNGGAWKQYCWSVTITRQ